MILAFSNTFAIYHFATDHNAKFQSFFHIFKTLKFKIPKSIFVRTVLGNAYQNFGWNRNASVVKQLFEFHIFQTKTAIEQTDNEITLKFGSYRAPC